MRSHSGYIKTSILVDEDDIDVKVAYQFHSACRGARDSLCGVRNAGPQLEPDEPASVEILKIFNIATGAEIEVDKEQEEALIEDVFEALSEIENDRYERD